MTLGPQFDGQLKLFMTPAEIMGHVNASGDKGRDEDMSDMWSRKVEASKRPFSEEHGSGVYDKVNRGFNLVHGIRGTGKVPILYNVRGPIDGEVSRELKDMHHRVAAMAEVDRKKGTETFVNVDHTEWSKDEGRRF